MAVVVLCSTMSFTVSMHYCGDTLIDTAILEKARSCGMQDMSKGDMELMKGCCSTEEFQVEGQDIYMSPIVDLSPEQQLFIASFVYSYNLLFPSYEQDVQTFKDFPPPFTVRHIFKRYETYLI